MNKTYQEALAGASSLLTAQGIDPDNARYVLEYRAGFSPSQLRLHGRDPLPEALAQQFAADVKRLLQHEPAQYIVGLAPFFGEDFIVSPAVLIPRFETEELVAWARDEIMSAQTLLDVGTGSGVIGLTLKRLCPQLAVTLVDVSTAALAVAGENAKRQHLAVSRVQSDLFSGLGSQRFDRIMANLPYISHQEEAVMDQSTLTYEPQLALFAEHDGLALFERFCQQVAAHLNAGAQVYLEFGYHQQPALAALFAKLLPQAQVTFRQDMAGHPRMAKLAF
ncbi:peptide chain release factor N(5)-glutamine methyltransferase [Lacticaseibacillus baoqingensis]|uniref:peptide chain release factor N(5)-glutamine methyltransferase n=1 Tax=Lacticaseibacillus baoqingensis TaxID=2486013 RepID=A0ABW4E8H7_9LACO|nr:peptide chain release factor N(5)-glutamine methyltransferase [Lacticaseibacillus baoqingensis]